MTEAYHPLLARPRQIGFQTCMRTERVCQSVDIHQPLLFLSLRIHLMSALLWVARKMGRHRCAIRRAQLQNINGRERVSHRLHGTREASEAPRASTRKRLD